MGHLGANCPTKKPPLKSVVEQNQGPRFAWNVNDPNDIVDVHGFKTVTKGGRPRPHVVTMGMHITNSFASLGSIDNEEESINANRAAIKKNNREIATIGMQCADANRLQKPAAPQILPQRSKGSGTLGSGEPWKSPLTSCLAKPQAATSMGAQKTQHSGKFVNHMFPTLNDDIQHELQQMEQLMMLEEQTDELNIVRDTTKVKVAMDSGAVKHVTHPSTLPTGAIITPNNTGRHFSGAGGETIEKYGDCMTTMTTATGTEIAMPWNVACVARPLHAVSQVTGPADHPTGKHDVLFNNKRCVVVEPGVVEYILQHVKSIAEYPREGDLYLAEMELSTFGRQDLKR